MEIKKIFFLLAFCTAAWLGSYDLTEAGPASDGLAIPRGEKEVSRSVVLRLPARQAGQGAVLRFRAYLSNGGGWNNTMSIRVNGTLLREKMLKTGEYRLLRRGLVMESRSRQPQRPWWNGSGLLVFFGDGVNLSGKVLSTRDEGYDYLVDISDLACAGSNEIEFINGFRIRKNENPVLNTFLMVENIQAGLMQEADMDNMRPRLQPRVEIVPYWHNSREFIAFFSYPGAAFAPDASEKRLNLTFPAVPRKAGHTVVLGFRNWIGVPEPGGWNYYNGLLLNNGKLDSMTQNGEVRLLRRGAFMDTSLAKNPRRPWWKEGQLVSFFGNGCEVDSRLKNSREEGYSFLLDISDQVNYVEIGADNRIEKARENSLSLISSFRYRKKGILALAPSVFKDVVIGYVPDAALEKMRPAEEDSGDRPVFGSRLFTLQKKLYALDFWKGGAVTVKCGKSEYHLRDSFSYPGEKTMNFSSFSTADGQMNPEIRRSGDEVTMTMENPFFKVVRTVKLLDNQFHVTDVVTNISGQDQGMRLRFATTAGEPMQASRTFISGLQLTSFPDGMCGQNPTFFTQPAKGGSLGIYVYDDLLRNQSGFRRSRREFLLDNPHLGFAAAGSRRVQTLVRRFYPQPDAGYFDFVNQVRRDLKLNRLMSGMFGFLSRPMTSPRIKHYALSQWFEWDANSRWTGREDYRKNRLRDVRRIRAQVPDALCLGRLESNILHIRRESLPGGEKLPDGRRFGKGGVYGLELTEEQNKIISGSPFADSLMRNARGHAVVDTNYAHPGNLNLLVHFADGNHRLKNVLEQIDYILDVVGLDGVYLDQFVPGCDQELDNNKRCSYDKWDECTVDLNQDGTIRRKIYDYVIVGSSARAKIVRHVAAKGKLMYNNNHPVTVETNGLPSYSFCESGGFGTEMEVKHQAKPALIRCHALGQLSGSPITLGYAGDVPREQRARVFNRAIIVGLRHGMLYAQYGLIPDLKYGGAFAADYMYPITPVELGEGFIIGKERIISCISRKFIVKSEKKPRVLLGDEFGRQKKTAPEAVRSGDSWMIDMKLRDWNEVGVILLQ